MALSFGEIELEVAGLRCPLNRPGCRGGCEWQCPQCLRVVAHESFCWGCWFNWCNICEGTGVITDDSYTWMTPRVVRCPGCSPG